MAQRKKVVLVISIITIILLLSGCQIDLLDPKGEIGIEQRRLILTALGVMLLVVIPAIIMVIAFSIKYRQSNTTAKYSPSWGHSYKIEAVVWALPILIIIFLGIKTWKTTHLLDPNKPIHYNNINPLTIEVVSMDWKWLFIYPAQGVAAVNQVSFPINTPVVFKITSFSVMNSFFIPRLGSQVYAMAGMQTKLHLIANKPGIYKGISSAYSGRGFSGMKFTAIATDNVTSFNKWISQARNAPDTLNNMEALQKLAIPSENNKVVFFSRVKRHLFDDIINKFRKGSRTISDLPQIGMHLPIKFKD
ncbi:MAG: ubiquinol oxidase subunit II [Candidatus Dasytiphilus stammeri]